MNGLTTTSLKKVYIFQIFDTIKCCKLFFIIQATFLILNNTINDHIPQISCYRYLMRINFQLISINSNDMI